MIDFDMVKVLLVEDDEDDYIIVRALLSDIAAQKFELTWARNFNDGLQAMADNQHDVSLVDYRLGARNGVELLQEAVGRGCQSPIILLTGTGAHQVDLAAMQAGAADYLVKGRLEAHSLERSIRYALQRKRAAALAAFEQARLAAFGADVGLALTRQDSVESILERCTSAMLQYLNAAFAQISIFDAQKRRFEPKATSGVISGAMSASQIAHALDVSQLSERKPVIIKQVLNDERLTDQPWAARESIVSFAAYPLVLEEKLVGLMSIFTRHPLTEQIAQEMSSVANGIALCIERKRSEEALGVSETRYRSVVQNIQEVVFQLDQTGNWTFLNPAWTAITGFEVQSALGTLFLDYIHEEDRAQNSQTFLELTQRRLDRCRYETRFLTRAGTVRWVEVYAQLTVSDEQASAGISGSLTDITDRKVAETQIQKLAAFPRVNPNPVLEFAMDGTLSYANDAARDMAKTLGKEELLAILPAQASAIARDCLQTSKKRLREEVTLNERTLTWSFFPIQASQVVHCYGFDITDVLNLEAQFRHAQKLESVGQLAAGVAHDFNNILTVIQGYSDSLLARNHGEEFSKRALKQISEASRRAATLTRQLLTFSRKQLIQPKVLDLNALLRNLTNMLSRLLGEDIGLEADYGAELPRIEADAGMVEQIVMNLAVNSRDAMPKGGRLLIRTSKVEVDAQYASQHADARIGQFVQLIVTDNGCGMEPKTLERIFEPFFSTKEVGRGTGLGLATVYGIVKQHQGWIQVRSEPGKGTTFTIHFPALSKREEPTEPPMNEPHIARGGKETILLVEDEPDVREFVSELLREYEYRVLQAESGPQALKVWEAHSGKIDLLLTDMVMPEGMSGRDLAYQLRKRKPDLKVIYSSGYSSATRGDIGQNETAFLAKPYHPPELANMVRQCLDSPLKDGSDILPL
jgi:PAS domain S-box-containing protein